MLKKVMKVVQISLLIVAFCSVIVARNSVDQTQLFAAQVTAPVAIAVWGFLMLDRGIRNMMTLACDKVLTLKVFQ